MSVISGGNKRGRRNDAGYDDRQPKPTEWGNLVEHNKAVSRRWIEVFNERDDQVEAERLQRIRGRR
jgi:hypothetical protein